MKIFSEKIKYSISAVYELAKHYLKGPLHLKDVALPHGIPNSYLLQLMNKLKGKGIVSSIRGSQGGYELAKPPDQIKILDIIQALDGEFKTVNYSEKSDDVLSVFWVKIDSQIKEILNITIGNLLNQEFEINFIIKIFIFDRKIVSSRITYF